MEVDKIGLVRYTEKDKSNEIIDEYMHWKVIKEDKRKGKEP